MSRRGAGWSLISLGAASIVAGLIGLLSGDPPPELEVTETTLAAASSETTTTSEANATTTIAETTTTTMATTTTIPTETVEEFIAAFAAAVEADDQGFLFDRLHPLVIERYGEEVCRSWIGEEIIALGDYRLTGVPQGPVPRTMQTPEGDREIEVITAPVSFSFQGESFEASAGLSPVDGVIYWLGECR